MVVTTFAMSVALTPALPAAPIVITPTRGIRFEISSEDTEPLSINDCNPVFWSLWSPLKLLFAEMVTLPLFDLTVVFSIPALTSDAITLAIATAPTPAAPAAEVTSTLPWKFWSSFAETFTSPVVLIFPDFCPSVPSFPTVEFTLFASTFVKTAPPTAAEPAADTAIFNDSESMESAAATFKLLEYIFTPFPT